MNIHVKSVYLFMCGENGYDSGRDVCISDMCFIEACRELNITNHRGQCISLWEWMG
jgi:hypothetical protein